MHLIIHLKKTSTLTKKVVEYAHAKGISVEAELGTVGGQEDDVQANGVIYADAKECEELVKQTGVDCLAPALGSVHGPYKGEPNLVLKKWKRFQMEQVYRLCFMVEQEFQRRIFKNPFL